MPRVSFTQNIQRHVPCPPSQVDGATVREVLDVVFADNRQARGYVLDEQGELRHHVVVFVDGQPLKDRRNLSDWVGPESEVAVFQALSGG